MKMILKLNDEMTLSELQKITSKFKNYGFGVVTNLLDKEMLIDIVNNKKIQLNDLLNILESAKQTMFDLYFMSDKRNDNYD